MAKYSNFGFNYLIPLTTDAVWWADRPKIFWRLEYKINTRQSHQYSIITDVRGKFSPLLKLVYCINAFTTSCSCCSLAAQYHIFIIFIDWIILSIQIYLLILSPAKSFLLLISFCLCLLLCPLCIAFPLTPIVLMIWGFFYLVPHGFWYSAI